MAVVAAALFAALGAAGAAEAPGVLSLIQRHATKVTPAPARCVVWHSQHKSAGRQIENLLGWLPLRTDETDLEDYRATEECKIHCDAEIWDCKKQTCTMEDYVCNRNIERSGRIAMAGYAPTLSGSSDWGSPGDGKCVWATMSREPVSRLVSAFLYCNNTASFDPLCGARAFTFENSSIQEFAKHWGNYLFRELMWDPKLHEMAASRADYLPDVVDCTDPEELASPSPWYQFKEQLNGGDDPSTPSGKLNFQAVKDRLLQKNGEPPLYDIYGVVEMWNETMAIFDDRLPLISDKPWSVLTNTGGHLDHGSSRYEDYEKKLLAKARTDKVVLKALAGDIELYNDIIVPLFKEQVKARELAA